MNYRDCHHALAAVAVLTSVASAGSVARADTFTVHNGSTSQISVGFGTSDPSCATGFRNMMWIDVGAGQAVPIHGVDVVNAFLVTAIHFRDGGFKTVAIDGNLSNYIWDTPLTGSNECTTYHGPGDHFGYSVFNLSCNSTISHPGMLVLGESGVPTALVGCINNLSGPGGPATPCEMDPDQDECVPL